MKIIVAGMPKTGTKSMAKALRLLGYEVYDYLEHFIHHKTQWKNILLRGGTIDEFKKMYTYVDAVTDVPACFYWEQILEAFPDSKIIFIRRSSEEEWFRSMEGQLDEGNALLVRLLVLLTPTTRALQKFTVLIAICVFACKIHFDFFGKAFINKFQYIMMYKRHNANFDQRAPKDQVLEFSVKDGWSPLCKFLNKKILEVKFPQENRKGTSLVQLFKEEPILKKCIREALLTASVCILLIALCLHWLGGFHPY